MANIITGDITNIEEGVLLHQVNCQNAMGSGVAKALYSKFPNVKREFHLFNKGKKPNDLLGELYEVKINDSLSVLNSYSQLTYGWYGKHTDETILIENIKKGVQIADDKQVPLYIPYNIGCDRGGGNWDTVYSAIKDLDITIIKLG